MNEMKRFVNGDETTLSTGHARVKQDGDRLRVVTPAGTSTALVARSGSTVLVSYRGRQFRVEAKRRSSSGGHAHHAGFEVAAPMPGTVVFLHCRVGDEVMRGESLLTLEAMKMQHHLVAPTDGTVIYVGAVLGEQVSQDDLLITLEPKG